MLLPLGHVMAGEGAGLAHQTIFSDLFSSPHAPSCSPAPCTYTSSSFLVTTTLATTSWFHSVLLFIVISQAFFILTLSLQRLERSWPCTSSRVNLKTNTSSSLS